MLVQVADIFLCVFIRLWLHSAFQIHPLQVALLDKSNHWIIQSHVI